MKNINDFERNAEDDFQRIWDNINELQEITNITMKNMEDIYDKDILPLQNFKTSAENDMKKVRTEMDDFLQINGNNDNSFINGSLSQDTVQILAKVKTKLDVLEEEQQRQKKRLEKMQESQNRVRSEIQRIFEDIDHFKKQSQTFTQEQLKFERELQRIEDVRITDLSNILDIHSRKLEDLTEFQEKSISDAKVVQQAMFKSAFVHMSSPSHSVS